ncbi:MULTISPECIES: glycerophosphodiester phosphodiesterase [Nocardiopsis]|uniref:Glycerophosphoryl diester phosphodiesterase n=1 Tax=Nocardiopsis dassonvillei (strain ATCC 23218 / DSM 43111 / CIP 107115 / JCM 7437 / KCTC 9190 / NBRC 14626 / NCTC 10488 / NRRL B-5397 / IMRU 509) TaxID=446468 RepID=D7AXE9_NOCDD|nr:MULTISPECIES: glycerophosphodiester phosphodiesterase family protein [Nocardiopsis]ADH66023.1 glycerophosphoryl diester phosphodiesterase [Nocardiopsis dassonvillei subsp. dassonvillei DSM 43111]APC38307.1 glycerophosphodiester phosphodiesterase [Nocardiopsis dassonvillei]NKY79043.1 glycerophosphodiester phosphodiesterase [Nocardiopsis dassonvillei]VEI92044.1 Glycerophosphoryl diester phosphodiesterase [Nocardiopsis dassonvillei]
MQRIGIVVAAVSFFVVTGASASSATQDADPRWSDVTRSAVIEYTTTSERPLIAVSHRGASGHAPENTLAALDAADRLGAETVEVDVQRTKDDVLVLMHDTTLERTTDVEEVFPDRGSYEVGDFTMEEVRRLDAGAWFDSSFDGEPVPTFAEGLDRMEQLDLNLFLELKEPGLYPGIEQEIADELTGRGTWLEPNPDGEPRRLVLQSFDWESVRRSKDLLPSVPHALLGRVPESSIDEHDWAQMINPNHTTIDAAYVERVHEAGMEIMPYTINERSRMDTVLGWKVDGFITDYPDVGQEAIAARTKRSQPVVRIPTLPLPR